MLHYKCSACGKVFNTDEVINKHCPECGGEVDKVFDSEYFRQMGKRGGTTTKERHGSEHFSNAGRKGGIVASNVRDSHEFARMGGLASAEARKAKKQKAYEEAMNASQNRGTAGEFAERVEGE